MREGDCNSSGFQESYSLRLKQLSDRMTGADDFRLGKLYYNGSWRVQRKQDEWGLLAHGCEERSLQES